MSITADKKALVVRHNKLIESRHKLSLTERRFMLWIVSQITKDDKDFKIYKISVKNWEKFVGLKPTKNTYTEIFKMANSLTRRNVGIKSKENRKGNRAFKFISWFGSVEYREAEGAIEAILNPELKPFLLQLKEQYT